MADIRPFRALRPPAELASEVASPPYDVLNSAEAAALAGDNPNSFLHVIKPEIDLPEGTNLYSDAVYAKGAQNLKGLVESGALVRDDAPCLYVYQQRMGDHVQVGLVAGASVAEYDNGLIKKHEKTRQNKEDDRTKHVDTLNAYTGPVFLTYRQSDAVDALIAKVCASDPNYDFVADDAIGHTLWAVSDEGVISQLQDQFSSIGHLYIADGHHRSASASRVAALRKDENDDHTGNEEYNFFLSVIFPDNQMQILDYNRVVFDLNGLSQDAFMTQIESAFEVQDSDSQKPAQPRSFKMFIDGSWKLLTAKASCFPADDPVDSLDVSILQNNLLGPILGIEDPRTSKGIDFVGGIRGMAELERRVNDGAAVAFALFPTRMDELFAIADADEIMPPKSTWFEPKLRSGLIVKEL